MMASQTPTQSETNLTEFLKAAGQSLSKAQESLNTSANPSGDILINQAQLDIKVALNHSADELAIKPISTADIYERNLNPGLLSTLNLNFVATARETPATSPPKLSIAEVIQTVRQREDIIALEAMLGQLKIDAQYVSQLKRWLVIVTNSTGDSVRELILVDKYGTDPAVVKGQISEVNTLFNGIKTELLNYYSDKGQFPSTLAELKGTPVSSTYVADFSYERIGNQLILQASMKDSAAPEIAGKTIRYTYYDNTWYCRSGEPNGVPETFLPNNCQHS
jgi:hypothetical protein